jgi:hypothetical protein
MLEIYMLIIGASNAAEDRVSASAKHRTPGGRQFRASAANRGLPEDVLKDEIPAAGVKKAEPAGSAEN